MILHALEKVASEKGFSVDNYGMYSAEDECQLTYVQELCLHVILFQV